MTGDRKPAVGDLYLVPGVDRIELDRRVMTCMAPLADGRGFVFSERGDTAAVSLTDKEIRAAFKSGRLTYLRPNELDLPEEVRPLVSRLECAFTPSENARRDMRAAFVAAVEAAGARPVKGDRWQPVIDACAVELGCKTYDWQTVKGWWRKVVKAMPDGTFDAARMDTRVLAGRDRDKGNRTRRLHPLQLGALEERLPTYLRQHRPKIAMACVAVNDRIDEINEARGSANESVPYVSYDVVYREIRKIGREVLLHHRNGAQAAEQAITPKYRASEAFSPLQRAQGDFKYLGLFVVDDTSSFPLGTPLLGAVIDEFSGMTAGFDIGFDPPSSASAARCLEHVIMPKDLDAPWLLDADGERIVDGEWPVNGVPQVFILDNDAAFQAKTFEMSAQTLGCSVQYAEPGNPKAKRYVERFWRVIDESYVDQFDGRILRTWKKPDRDYDPKELAVVTLGELKAFLTKAIVDVHSITENARHGERRIDVWRGGVKIHPPRPPRRHDDVAELVGEYVVRTAGPRGLRLHGLFFNSDELARYRAGFLKDPKVEVRFKSNDLTYVLLVDRKGDVVLKVPSTSPDYVRNLTLHQHKVIRAHAVSRGARGKIYRRDLMAARASLYRLGQEMVHDRKTKRRGMQRLARYFGHDQRMLTMLAAHPHDTEASRDPIVNDDDGEDEDFDCVDEDGPLVEGDQTSPSGGDRPVGAEEPAGGQKTAHERRGEAAHDRRADHRKAGSGTGRTVPAADDGVGGDQGAVDGTAFLDGPSREAKSDEGPTHDGAGPLEKAPAEGVPSGGTPPSAGAEAPNDDPAPPRRKKMRSIHVEPWNE